MELLVSYLPLSWDQMEKGFSSSLLFLSGNLSKWLARTFPIHLPPYWIILKQISGITSFHLWKRAEASLGPLHCFIILLPTSHTWRRCGQMPLPVRALSNPPRAWLGQDVEEGQTGSLCHCVKWHIGLLGSDRFLGFQTQAEARHWLSWVSSLKVANHGISLPPKSKRQFFIIELFLSLSIEMQCTPVVLKLL